MKSLIGRKSVLLAGILSAGLVFSFTVPANAGFVVKIEVAGGSGAKIVVDQDFVPAVGDFADGNLAANAINFILNGFDGWSVIFPNATTSDPALGLGHGAFLTLGALTTASAGPGVLTIWTTATDFVDLGALTKILFDVTKSGFGSMTAELFVDDANEEFAETTSVSFLSPFPGVTALSGSGIVAVTDPFSMTIKYVITHLGGGQSSRQGTARIAPIPGALFLFLSALGGLGLTGRFGRRANAAA